MHALSFYNTKKSLLFLLAVSFYPKRQSALVVQLGESIAKFMATCGGDKKEEEIPSEKADLEVVL
jgi:hypothetical protein